MLVIVDLIAAYLRGRSKSDIVIRSLSADGITGGARDTWVIVQDEHATFENQLLVAQLRARETPWTQFQIEDRIAAQLFRLNGR